MEHWNGLIRTTAGMEERMKGWPGEPEMEYDVLVADGDAARNAGRPITDVIFDFGNVLVYWDPRAVMTPRYSDELIDRFLDNDISGFYDINDELDAGMSNDEGVALMRERYGDKWADMMQYYLDNFVDSLTGVVPGARVLINDLKAAGIHVWGLSNWQKDLVPVALERYDILRSLEDRVVSGYVGLRKPHRDIYDYALRQFGIDASGALFVDDKAMNIVGANKAGIRGVRFKNSRALRALLIDAGVDIPAVREV